MNLLAQLFRAAMDRIKATPWQPHARHTSNRAPLRTGRHRGYYVNGKRVFYRPAAPWVPNKHGTRFEAGKRIAR